MSTEEYIEALSKQLKTDDWVWAVEEATIRYDFRAPYNIGFIFDSTVEGFDFWSNYFYKVEEAWPDLTPKTPEIKAKLERIYYNYKLGIEPL